VRRGPWSTRAAGRVLTGTVCAVTAALVLALAPPSATGAPDVPAPTTARAAATTFSTTDPNPFVDADQRVRNGVFYYTGTVPLDREHVPELKRTWGSPAVVVTTPKADEAAAVDAIHATGALAYRYVQFFWAPDNTGYEGIDLTENPDWAFCRSGSQPVRGRTTDSGSVDWHFIDANERAVRLRLRQLLTELRETGWDGVMFDRGQAATQYAQDAAGRDVWHVRSSCTEDPYVRGARFADAYVAMLRLAKAVGLRSIMNNGASPFQQPVRMRPDPDDADCRARRWASCRFLDDVWGAVDLVLSETATALGVDRWDRHFAANRLNERHDRYRNRVLNLVTTANLGGEARQNRRNVFYAWSRIKLFNLPVAVNTGTGGCGPDGSTSGVCNRYGVYPELVDTVFGVPLSTRPARARCADGGRHRIRCVWTRTYARGMNVVNVRGESVHDVRLQTGLSTCRYVYDVFRREPVAGGRCVRAFTLDLGAWRGRPLRYSTQPFA
jgi:hypothetical protein